MRNEIRLRAELVKLKIKLKVKNNEDLISYRDSGNVRREKPFYVELKIKNFIKIVLPRYVRVNTLKTTAEKVIEHFQLEGYVLDEPTKVLDSLR